jgi:hypothetical protein
MLPVGQIFLIERDFYPRRQHYPDDVFGYLSRLVPYFQGEAVVQLNYFEKFRVTPVSEILPQ